MYLKVLENGDIIYPYTLKRLRKDLSTVSFPDNISDELLSEFGVFPVVASEPLKYDALIEKLVEQEPTIVDGRWVQKWHVEPLMAQEIMSARHEAHDTMKTRRKDAFILEADPLFFKWQAGEVSKETWMQKREEIRQRYPLPDVE